MGFPEARSEFLKEVDVIGDMPEVIVGQTDQPVEHLRRHLGPTPWHVSCPP
jgi:hypothetical protein